MWGEEPRVIERLLAEGPVWCDYCGMVNVPPQWYRDTIGVSAAVPAGRLST